MYLFLVNHIKHKYHFNTIVAQLGFSSLIKLCQNACSLHETKVKIAL